MNERIQKLYIQVVGDDKLNFDSYLAEKFAELIVRECAKTLDDKLANPNGASMAWCDGSDLLAHFGVEE
jgi:hypothetical protein